MKAEIKSTGPDGLIVNYETFFHTWEEALEFLRLIAKAEASASKGGKE